MKSQDVRLLDVFVLGPFMLYAALKPARMTGLERAALAIAGVATVLYNWQNYQIERERAA